MNPSYPWLVVAIAAGVTLFTRARRKGARG